MGQLIGRLGGVLENGSGPWSLLLVGEDQAAKLVELVSDLSRPFSTTGDGKRLTSGFWYWGAGPMTAWVRAAGDPTYLERKYGSESFPGLWAALVERAPAGCTHLVSLGVGNGDKDRTILADMRRDNPGMLYVPVDMSSEMLRHGTDETVRHDRFPESHLLPVQLDFSIPGHAVALAGVVARLVGDAPVLYSLTGNTLANFTHDRRALRNLAGILRPQDRLLLEVSTTPNLDVWRQSAAMRDYQPRAFTEFVTSALRYSTDLTVGLDAVHLSCRVERGDALAVRVVWRQEGGEPVTMSLPDHSTVALDPGDTIRLFLTRKYTEERLARMIAACGLGEVAAVRTTVQHRYPDSGFGLALLLLARTGEAVVDDDEFSRVSAGPRGNADLGLDPGLWMPAFQGPGSGPVEPGPDGPAILWG